MNLNYIGSFQKDALILSEDPLEEVWSRICQYGSYSFLKKHFKPDKENIDWEKYLRYAEVRIRQSLEFREAAHQSSLLTAPLTLYYSFLNLKRAFLALGPEIISRRGHGLVFKEDSNLLDAKAILSQGTFTDYLEAMKINWIKGSSITLADSLGHIIELADDYKREYPNKCFVSKIIIRAFFDGTIRLIFPDDETNFMNSWSLDYPALSNLCHKEENGNVLVLSDKEPYVSANGGYEAIANFADKNFLPNLILLINPIWYILKKNNNVLKLPRAAYYYISNFILGSAVRYHPELMLEASSPGSDLYWLLKRFITLSERYYPQLKLMEGYKSQLYFSSS